MKRILTALLLLMLTTSAWGQDFEKGLQAYGRGDYATAIQIWRPLAERGNAEAQLGIGDILYIGKNYKEALPWYLRSAKQGNAKAQHSLAMIYGGAEGVPQNFAQANKWLMKAAERGRALAQYDLGLVYSKGRGVPNNSVKALMWFTLAAANKDIGYFREYAVTRRDELVSKMTLEQIAEGQRLASEWKAKE